ncbi:mating-type protein A1 [Pelomyxa schiedti]|nr:mating-type protein A1 [Pelomyxa schiedti]
MSGTLCGTTATLCDLLPLPRKRFADDDADTVSDDDVDEEDDDAPTGETEDEDDLTDAAVLLLKLSQSPTTPVALHNPAHQPATITATTTTTPTTTPTSCFKPKRQRTSPEQLDLLEQIFQTNTMPNQQTRMHLAAELGMSTRRIQIWFQNKRAKVRRTAMRQDGTTFQKPLQPVPVHPSSQLSDKITVPKPLTKTGVNGSTGSLTSTIFSSSPLSSVFGTSPTLSSLTPPAVAPSVSAVHSKTLGLSCSPPISGSEDCASPCGSPPSVRNAATPRNFSSSLATMLSLSGLSATTPSTPQIAVPISQPSASAVAAVVAAALAPSNHPVHNTPTQPQPIPNTTATPGLLPSLEEQGLLVVGGPFLF